METGKHGDQQERRQLISDKRKWQMEMENKRRQLEDDRRALQHLKSKALRERWLLDGASAGPEQDEVRTRLDLDEAKTRTLEDAIRRLEKELVYLESGGVCHTVVHTTVTSGPAEGLEVKGHTLLLQDQPPPLAQLVEEVKVEKSLGFSDVTETSEEMKRAVYSLEITVQRDRATGETKVLSSHTKLPVDLSCQGVKVYEDERKVVHEMNGEDGVHLLSSSEVDDLIHKAEEASMMTQTSPEKAEVAEEAEPTRPAVRISEPDGGPDVPPGVAEASSDKPVTMVFMGYQSVEDEDQTKRVLGVEGSVKAELVVIPDANGMEAAASPAPTPTPTPTPTEAPAAWKTAGVVVKAGSGEPPGGAASNGGSGGAANLAEGEAASGGTEKAAGEPGGGAAASKKDKQPCKCCTIM